jgi:molybdopterin converting factor small subunit
MKVLIPSPLFSYTGGHKWAHARGATLGEVLADLDRQYPGIRFRMVDEQDCTRRHMRFFVRGEPVFDLGTPLAGVEELVIVQALSGG